jgi:hypothetical protein
MLVVIEVLGEKDISKIDDFFNLFFWNCFQEGRCLNLEGRKYEK